jgi:hypothetical protein
MRDACAAAAERARNAVLAWLRIYGGPETAGLLAAALAFGLVRAGGGPLVGSALLGSWAEDIAFIGYFAVRAVRAESKRHRHHHWISYYLLTFGLAFWGLLIELGPAEAVDKFVRPALLYEIPRNLHNIVVGFILAKFAADIVYYFLAWVGRSVRKRYPHPSPAPAPGRPVRHASPVLAPGQPARHASPVLAPGQPARHASPVLALGQPARHASPVLALGQPVRHASPVLAPGQPARHLGPARAGATLGTAAGAEGA